MFDNIDFNERERDGDAVILDLFHQWQAALKDANDVSEGGNGSPEEKAYEAKMDIVRETEHHIASTAASGAAGLAIKGFLAADSARPVFDPFLIGILDDGVRFVPELGPLAEKILAEATLAASIDDKERAAPLDLAALRERVAAIVAEFDLPLPDGDAGIFEAARRKRDLDARFRALYGEFGIDDKVEEAEINPQRDRLEDPLIDYLEKHARPQTLAAAAVLLQRCFEGGITIDPDDGMLGNVLALIEREAGSGGAR